MPKGIPETVEVTVTVSYEKDGKKLQKSETERHPIRGTDLEDFKVLAATWGAEERKDSKTGEVISPSEKTNVMLWLTNVAQNGIEYGGLRQTIRNKILDTLPEDPVRTQKTILSQIKAMRSLFDSEEEAKAFVLKQRVAKGLPV